MEKIRAAIREILLERADERESQAREADRKDNVLFAESLKGQSNGLHEAYHLIDKYLKEYEKNPKRDSWKHRSS